MSSEDDRLLLRANGYIPTPCAGKRPVLTEWQKRLDPTEHEIQGWSRWAPGGPNTGILARTVPALDIDLVNEAAAQAVEDMATEWFEEHGWILVRGREGAPKRLIPFRTDEPFGKFAVTFGERGKLEMLGDGQQFIALGDHPDTGKPYKWEGRSPLDTPREELPYIHRWEAREFIQSASKLLVDNFDYRLPPLPAKPKAAWKTDDAPCPARFEKMLRGLIKCVAESSQGNRNAVLFWAACRIGESMRDGAVSRSQGLALLMWGAEKAGLPLVEADRTIKSGLRATHNE